MNTYVNSLIGKSVYVRVRLQKSESGYVGKLVTALDSPSSTAQIELTEDEVERYALSWKQTRNNEEHHSTLFKAGDLVQAQLVRGQFVASPNDVYIVIGDESKHKRLIRAVRYCKHKTYEEHINDPSCRTYASVFFSLYKAFKPYQALYNEQTKNWDVVKLNPYLHTSALCLTFSSAVFSDAKERAENYAKELNTDCTPRQEAVTPVKEEPTENKFIPSVQMRNKFKEMKCDHTDIESIRRKAKAMYGDAFTVLSTETTASGTVMLDIRCEKCMEVFSNSLNHFLHTGYMLTERCPHCCRANFERGVVTIMQRMRKDSTLREVGLQIMKDIENYPVTDRESFIRRAEYIYGKGTYDYSAVHWANNTNGLSRMHIICNKHKVDFRIVASAWCDPRHKYKEYAFGADSTCGCPECAKELKTKNNNANA